VLTTRLSDAVIYEESPKTRPVIIANPKRPSKSYSFLCNPDILQTNNQQVKNDEMMLAAAQETLSGINARSCSPVLS
jgi:hypothetical protein